MKISLNLGGGSARGFAHIGVIRCLLKEKVPFDMIIGISAGATVGAIYSSKPDVDHLEATMLDMINSPEFQGSLLGNFTKRINQDEDENILKRINKLYAKTSLLGKMLLTTGMMSQEEIEDILYKYIPNIDISDTYIPLSIVTVNLVTGKKHVFQEGSLREAVIASSAMPLVCPPRIINGTPFVDGGVLDKVGIDTSYDMQIPYTIAVDVSNETLNKSMIANAIDVILRTEEIASVYRRKKQIAQATVLIQPIVGNIHWADYSSHKELIERGYEATQAKIEEIREKLKLTSAFKKIFTFLNRKPTPATHKIEIPSIKDPSSNA